MIRSRDFSSSVILCLFLLRANVGIITRIFFQFVLLHANVGRITRSRDASSSFFKSKLIYGTITLNLHYFLQHNMRRCLESATQQQFFSFSEKSTSMAKVLKRQRERERERESFTESSYVYPMLSQIYPHIHT